MKRMERHDRDAADADATALGGVDAYEPLSVPGAARPDVATLHVTVRYLTLRPQDRPKIRPSRVSSARWSPSVITYRQLHQQVGGDCCWWMERARPEDAQAARLREAGRSVHMLYARNQCIGYFELLRMPSHSTHLCYFGLYPKYRGRHLGRDALQEALLLTDPAVPVTLTTSSLDSPRALPLYLDAGFRESHVDEQIWDVPREFLP